MSTRLGVALGLGAATAVAAWWLGASRTAIVGGTDAASSQATHCSRSCWYAHC